MATANFQFVETSDFGLIMGTVVKACHFLGQTEDGSMELEQLAKCMSMPPNTLHEILCRVGGSKDPKDQATRLIYHKGLKKAWRK